MSDTLKTVIHMYYFDVSYPQQAIEYDRLRARLLNSGVKCHNAPVHPARNAYYDMLEKMDGTTIELQTKHLFDDQWNTAPIKGVSHNGVRVFDWFEHIYPNRDIKRGHYLEQTPEMKYVRENAPKCGFCGQVYPIGTEMTFCATCLSSEYLSRENLHKALLLPVHSTKTREECFDGSNEEMLEAYHEAQSKRVRNRLEDQTESVINKATRQRQLADMEEEGMLWLAEHDVDLGNVIFYSHNESFTIGWRNAIAEKESDRILSFISDFPYSVKVVCSDGRRYES